MKYCTKCGNAMQDLENYCGRCGYPSNVNTNINYTYNNQNYENSNCKVDKPSILLIILSFLIPIAGFILYFYEKKEHPKSAKGYLICGIVGWVLGAISILAGGFQYNI